MIIQFNSILIYLRANLTAQRPITKLSRVRSKKQQQYIYNNNNNNNNNKDDDDDDDDDDDGHCPSNNL
jgi:hypothetical protein